MAKSLRSKPKLRAKSIKRKNEFSKFVDSRNERLAQRMKVNEETMEEDPVETNEPKEEKKISTSGWRQTSRQKLKQKKKNKKNVTKF